MKLNTLYFSLVCFLVCVGNLSANDNNPYSSLRKYYWDVPTTMLRDTLPPLQPRIDAGTEAKNPFDLNDPKAIDHKVDYDPETGYYIITEKIDAFNYRTPVYMTPEEYLNWRKKEDDKAYLQELADRNSSSNAVDGDPLENYKDRISNSLVDRLFCGSNIDVRPQGSMDITFGWQWQKIANPMLTEQQQSNGNFDFDMNIQLSVTGKVGEKLQLSFQYNTQATFDFDRQIKIEYLTETECSEDDIVKKIEAGNVSFPLRSSLIQGRQNLFGFRTDLQFGKLKTSFIASESQNKRKEIQIQGGAQLQEFEVTADRYEENRHFFLSHYNRASYEENLQNLPQINTLFNVTKLEVWVTNDRNVTDGVRDVVGFADLGETDATKMISGNQYLNGATELGIDLFNRRLPDNNANTLYNELRNSTGARDLQSSISALQIAPFAMDDARDFSKIRARKLGPSEYKFDPKLGFVSLNVSIKPTDVVAVAYQYTYNGKTYQVGEFSQDLPLDADTLNVMHLKLLKGVRTRVDLPIWDLMMKNVYSLGAYQINEEDFMLDLFYQDPGGGEKRFITEGTFTSKPLITLLNLDNLNRQRDPMPDGQFDFIPGLTIYPQNGRIIFPVLEPFGDALEKAFRSDPDDPKSVQGFAQKYVYKQLYDSTITRAREFPEFNRYLIKGRYKSSVSSEISLGGFNIPRGSVVVSAGGRQLVEGSDYSVDYNLGRIKILNESYLNSGQPIRVTFEDNSAFGFTKQGFFGTRLEYVFNKDFNIGGTFLHLRERPFTQKVNYGDDPISNSIYGFDVQYKTEAPWLTRLIDKLPLISTKAMSSIAFTGEFAQLIPGAPNVINQGEDQGGVVYIDDFEGSASNFNLSIPSLNWVLASTPKSDLSNPLFPEAKLAGDWDYNKNRAAISWYSLEPLLTRDNTDGITDKDRGSIYVREIQQQDVFQNRQNNGMQYNGLRTFDMTYRPKVRGPYNFSVEDIDPNTGLFQTPQNKWGGIMRSIQNNDFEANNIEFIELWVMSPFKEGRGGNGGDLYIEIGDVSEDILKDSRLFFENGIPDANSDVKVDITKWSRIPRTQAVTNAFDNDPAIRNQQDVGYDGFDNDGEREIFQEYLDTLALRLAPMGGVNSAAYQEALNDPANDDFIFFRDAFYDNTPSGSNAILGRYYKNNNPQGNSTNDENSQALSTSTNIPDTEDLNRDNTLNEQESYFRYKIPIRKTGNSEVDFTQYTTDSVRQDYQDANGNRESVYWYQLKIPIDQFTSRIGGISDFRSIRFMRMYMTGFEDEATLRFARLDLIRNQWRRYMRSLALPGILIPDEDPNLTAFDVNAVNIEDNGSRTPFPYVLPPGVQRENIIGSFTNAQQNEQSQSIRVCNLQDGDARGIYKNIDLDMRVYKRLKMHVHAEDGEFNSDILNDIGDLTAFVRIGSDFESNYYEYEIPLTMSDPNGGMTSADIWLEENEFDFPLGALKDIKIQRELAGASLNDLFESIDKENPNNIVKVIGNPTLGQVKNLMIGVRNKKDDGLARCVELWVNELRLTGFDERGGYAGLARLDVQLADLGNVTAAGNFQSIGFGSIEQKVNERSREQIIQYDVSGTIKLDKFFPKKWGLNIPFYAQYSQDIRTPEYDPYQLDIPLQQRLNSIQDLTIREEIRRQAQTIRTISSFNFTNVRKSRTSKFVPLPIDISNFAFTYAQSSNTFLSPLVELEDRTEHRGVIDYKYAPGLKSIYPIRGFFKKRKKWHKWIALAKDFNFNPLPSNISFRNELKRNFGETTYRFSDDATSTWYDKQFVWDRTYAVQWSLAKSLRFNFNATNNAIIDEPEGRIDDEVKRDEVIDRIKELGRNKNYQHSVNVSYTLPFKKLPILDWINTKAQYNATYSWAAAPLNVLELGNVIQNSEKRQVTADFQFKKLYNKSKYLKKINGPKPKRKAKKETLPEKKTYPRRLRDIADKEERAKEKVKRKTERKKWRTDVRKIKERRQPSDAERLVIRPLMLLQRARINYNEQFSTVLPGFMPQSRYAGMDESFTKPGAAFILGQQPSTQWLDDAASNGWITDDILLNQQVIQTHSQNYSAKVTMEPIKGFKIDIDINKKLTENTSQLFKVDVPGGTFKHLNPMNMGSVSMTYLPIRTFRDKEGTKGLNSSAHFEKFEANREVISQRLGQGKHDDQIKNKKYTEGYGGFQQDVLIPSFLAAYTGQDATQVALSDIRKLLPMPNWKVTYNGLAKVKGLDKIFSSFSLTHGYKSMLTVNQFSTDLDYQENPFEKDINSQNYYSSFEVPNVVISEQFNPLIGIDMRLKNDISLRFQYKTSRNLSMSFTDYQLSEQNTKDMTIGFGWKIKDFKPAEIINKLSGKKPDDNTQTKVDGMNFNLDFGRTVAKDELDIKCDISFRDDKTINHILDQEQSVATRGMRTLRIGPSIEWIPNNRLSFRLFVDYSSTIPAVSTSFPITSTKGGLTVRFSLSQ